MHNTHRKWSSPTWSLAILPLRYRTTDCEKKIRKRQRRDRTRKALEEEEEEGHT